MTLMFCFVSFLIASVTARNSTQSSLNWHWTKQDIWLWSNGISLPTYIWPIQCFSRSHCWRSPVGDWRKVRKTALLQSSGGPCKRVTLFPVVPLNDQPGCWWCGWQAGQVLIWVILETEETNSSFFLFFSFFYRILQSVATRAFIEWDVLYTGAARWKASSLTQG